MNIWSKLITAVRGGLYEAGDSIIDSQALRILDQEIRDADMELRKSKEALAEIMAKHKLADDRVAKAKKQIEEYEGYALKALESSNEALALEVAERIATLEATLNTETEAAQGYAHSVSDLRESIQVAETNICRMKQQVDTVKATDSVQRAQAAVASRYAGSNGKMHTALESLGRIKQKHAERAARMEAAAEISSHESEDSLDAKLREAGITPNANSAATVLERLKNRKNKPDLALEEV